MLVGKHGGLLCAMCFAGLHGVALAVKKYASACTDVLAIAVVAQFVGTIVPRGCFDDVVMFAVVGDMRRVWADFVGFQVSLLGLNWFICGGLTLWTRPSQPFVNRNGISPRHPCSIALIDAHRYFTKRRFLPSTTNKPTLKITFEHTARGLICRDPLAKNAMRSKVVSHLGFIRFAYELLLVNLSLVSIVDR